MLTARHLQQVLTIAKEGTFNRAAQALNLSQPALTTSINTLEARLGLRLFLRSRSGAEPTAFGQHVIDTAPDILSRLSRLEEELHLLAGGAQGALKVAAGPLVVHGVLRHVVPAFCRAYPDFQLTVQTSSPDQIQRDVAAGRLDLGLGVLSAAHAASDVILRPLFEDQMEFVARADHPLCSTGVRGLADLLAYPISLPEVPGEFQHQIAAWEATLGHPLRTTLTTDQFDMIMDVVLDSDLLTCAPRRLVQPYVQDGRAVVLDHNGARPQWRVSAAYRPVSELSPVFALLLSMVEEWFLTPDGSTG